MGPRPRLSPASRLRPSRWPVRWRVAGVAAALTFMILLVFAAIVGRAVESRLVGDFRDELGNTAGQLSLNAQLINYVEGRVDEFRLQQLALASDAVIALVNTSGQAVWYPPVDLPPVEISKIRSAGDYEFASRTVQSPTLGAPLYIQFGRSRADLDRAIDRMWLFLIGGIFAGTILAAAGGILIAGRAMRPVSSLTAAAREIATTRDPSLRIPQPHTEDEIAELARTLDEMLGELDAARSETQLMVQAQREFVADASHELRTPLTSIHANLELLQERLDVTPGRSDEAQMTSSALRSSMRMRRLVADLLVLARADAGRHGERVHCDMAGAVPVAVTEVAAIAGDHDLALGPLASIEVLADPDELHRIVVNLVENGVRHTPAGTSVRVSVATDGEAAILEVADDGPGIPPGQESQIFGRFVRADGPADVSRSAGTGLGLAIVAALVAANGGDVSAGRSADLGGARFQVEFPIAGPEPPQEAEPRASEVSAKL